MGLNNILLNVVIALASTATCQVVQPEGMANNGEFKYLVYLSVEFNFPPGLFKPPNTEPTFYGGGVIVTEKWVVTCAHNFDEEFEQGKYYQVNRVTVLAGTKNKTSKSRAQEITVGFENVIKHGKFERADPAADIALIFLGENTFLFNDRVQPANLIKSRKELNIHSECMIVGWGAYRNNRNQEVDPEKARKGRVYIVENHNCERCLNDRPQKMFYDDSHLCVGCKGCEGCSMGSPGDSGSPVVQQIGGVETVVGLMKGGNEQFIRRCGVDSPGFIVKLSKFRNWMDRKMKERMDKHANERVRSNMAAAVAVASVAAAIFINRRFR